VDSGCWCVGCEAGGEAAYVVFESWKVKREGLGREGVSDSVDVGDVESAESRFASPTTVVRFACEHDV
jgi:hypothetical protein